MHPSPLEMHTREIPSSGERLPVIGCGTYVGFDRAPGAKAYGQLPGVLSSLFQAGGRVIDSSPMYGRAEETTGELLADQPGHRPFLATKVWTTGLAAGVRQIDTSFERLRTEHIDLLQVHNLVDWRIHRRTLDALKAAGRVCYLGITHYHHGAFDELEATLKAVPWDFLQVNYSLEDQRAADRLLPLAADLGVAVLVNKPLGGGRLVQGLRGRQIPTWASEIGCTTWADILLKFVLSHPAVTCAIPGTGSPAHTAENARAGQGGIPPMEFWAERAASLNRADS